jgi:threonine/homoserine/homoserine lactone efflux protein
MLTQVVAFVPVASAFLALKVAAAAYLVFLGLRRAARPR